MKKTPTGNEVDEQNNRNSDRNMRILSICDEIFEGSTSKFAKNIDLDQPTLSKIMNGRLNVGLKIIDLVAEHLPQINLNWLIAGRGAMFNEQKSYSEVDEEPDQYNHDLIAEMRNDIRRANKTIDILMDLIKKNDESVKSEK